MIKKNHFAQARRWAYSILIIQYSKVNIFWWKKKLYMHVPGGYFDGHDNKNSKEKKMIIIIIGLDHSNESDR